jgi:uncharacterized protein HemY
MLTDEGGTCVAERGEMAKKKAAEPKPKSRQKIVLVYKADERTIEALETWLEDLSREVKAPISVIIDMALNEFAKHRKFRPMPERLLK